MSSRREFLRLQAIGLTGIAMSGLGQPAASARLQDAAGALPPDTLCLYATDFPPQDAGAGADGGEGKRRAGVLGVSIRDSTWRFLVPLVGQFRLSPDCRRLAMLDVESDQIWVCDPSGADKRKVADLHGLPVWSPDSSSLIISALPAHSRPADLAEQKYETWRLELEGGGLARGGQADRDFVSDWSPDGSLFLARVYMTDPEPGTQMVVTQPDGTGRRQLTTARAYHTGGRFSPDGKQIAYTCKSRAGSQVWVGDLEGKSPRVVLQEPVGIAHGACWAPDGDRLAITRHDLKNRTTTVELLSLRTRRREELKLPKAHYNGCDWRG